MGTGYYVKQTTARMLANPRSAESTLYCERRFQDLSVSRAEAWMIGEGMAWLEAAGK